jgi:hypothetical protein
MCSDTIIIHVLILRFSQSAISTIFFLDLSEMFTVYNKQNNTWMLEDMNLSFTALTRELISSLNMHSKINFISPLAHVLFSICHIICRHTNVGCYCRLIHTYIIFIKVSSRSSAYMALIGDT